MSELMEEQGPKHDVFISYSRLDLEFARRLEKALKAYAPPRGLPIPQRRLSVFRDEHDLTGADLERALDQAVDDSQLLLVVCSPDARESRWVDREIRRFASKRGDATAAQRIVVVLVRGLPNAEANSPELARDKAFPAALIELIANPLASDYRRLDPRKDHVDRGVFEGAWFKTLSELYSAYGVTRAEIEVSGSNDGTVRVWQRASGAATAVLQGHTAPVTSVIFGPSSDVVVSGSRDGSVRVWSLEHPPPAPRAAPTRGSDYTAITDAGEAASGRQVLTLTGDGKGVTRLFLTTPRTLLSVSADGRGRIWELPVPSSAVALPDLGAGQDLWGAAFGAAGRLVAVAAPRKKVRLYRTNDGSLHSELGQPLFDVPKLVVSQDASIAVTAMFRRISIWRLAAPGTSLQKEIDAEGTRAPLVALTGDGKLLAVKSAPPGEREPYWLEVFETDSAKRVARLQVSGPPVDALAFDPSGRLLVAGMNDGNVRFWRSTQHRWIEQCETKQPFASASPGVMGRSLSFRPDRAEVVLTTGAGIRIFNTNHCSLVREFPTAGSAITRAITTPDDNLLITGDGASGSDTISRHTPYWRLREGAICSATPARSAYPTRNWSSLHGPKLAIAAVLRSMIATYTKQGVGADGTTAPAACVPALKAVRVGALAA